MALHDELLNLARDYLANQEQWSSIAQRLRFNLGKITYPEALEADLLYVVKPLPPDGTFAAVDGGLGTEEFHGLDLLVLRALAVQFGYKDGELVSHVYSPSRRPEPILQARSGLEQFEKLRFISLYRLKAELSCAIEVMQKHNPNYLLIDGSLAPLVSDKPPEDSQFRALYGEVVELYRLLYSTAATKNINLIGVTKDSRGRRFLDMLAKSNPESAPALEHASDTAFLDLLLQEGERTFVFRYSAHPTQNQVLKDLGEWGSRILTFYIKPVAGDRPLRIEFLAAATPFNQIAEVMAGLCHLHPHYAYPAVLIEADLRAAMEGEEVEQIVADLSARLGRRRFMPLRRNSRPFR